MNPVRLLLNRPTSYRGLGLVALCSALIGPLTLEVIYNHADLWFQGLWQDDAFTKVWLIWTGFGVLMTCSWGLDRGFLGLDSKIHRNYALSLSLIGVSVYLLFGVSTWVWLIQMSLVQAWEVLSSVFVSAILLAFASLIACLIESYSAQPLLSLVTGNVFGFAFLYWFYVTQ